MSDSASACEITGSSSSSFEGRRERRARREASSTSRRSDRRQPRSRHSTGDKSNASAAHSDRRARSRAESYAAYRRSAAGRREQAREESLERAIKHFGHSRDSGDELEREMAEINAREQRRATTMSVVADEELDSDDPRNDLEGAWSRAKGRQTVERLEQLSRNMDEKSPHDWRDILTASVVAGDEGTALTRSPSDLKLEARRSRSRRRMRTELASSSEEVQSRKGKGELRRCSHVW